MALRIRDNNQSIHQIMQSVYVHDISKVHTQNASQHATGGPPLLACLVGALMFMYALNHHICVLCALCVALYMRYLRNLGQTNTLVRFCMPSQISCLPASPRGRCNLKICR